MTASARPRAHEGASGSATAPVPGSDAVPGQTASPSERTQLQRLQATLDSMLDPFIRLDAVRDAGGALIDLRYAEVNNAAVAYNRLTREQMIGARLLDLFPGQLEHGPLRDYFRTIETGEPTVLQEYAYAHEVLGQERRYDIVATRAGDGIALTWRDVTDRHRAAQELAASKDMFRLLAENSSDVVILRDEHLRILWASPSTASVLGVEVADVVGRPVTEFVDPVDVTAMTVAIDEAHASGIGLHYRIRVRTGAGEYRWFEGRNRPIATRPGEPPHWVVSLQDIDERVRAEQDLVQREELYRLLAENTHDVILLADPDTRISWASPSSESILGWGPTDLVGHRSTEFIHPDDVATLRADVERSTRTGEAIYPRYRWRRPDGTYHWMGASGRPVIDERTGDPHRVVTMRDVDAQVRAESELAQSEALYRLLAENSTDVIILAGADRVAQWVSPSVTTMLGWQPDDLVGRPPDGVIHPDDLPGIAGQHASTIDGRDGTRERYRVRCADGRYRWVEAATRPVQGDPGADARVVVRLRDIDDQVRAENDLTQREEQYRLLAENASDMVVQVEPDGTVVWASPSVRGMLGWDVEELVGIDSLALVHPDDRRRARDARLEGASGRPAVGEFRILRKDGSALWTSLTIHPVPTDTGFARILALRDIQDEVEARTRLDFALRHDQSTGLPTRAVVADILRDELTRASDPSGIAVLTIGVDLLKDVNDAYGHAAGDVVVAAVADRVISAVGRSHVVGRGTGDEFMVILTDMLDPAEAAAIAERVRIGVHGELALTDRTVAPTVSIGIAMGRTDGSSEDLQQEATLALHRAKELGRDRWAFADADLARAAARRMAMESAIREGLDAGEFEPWFQPIVSLSDDTVVGYEALIRWQHRDQVMDPSQFLDVALRTPMIADLDLAMVEPVVVALASRPEPVFIAVNVTGQTLARVDYATYVAECLARHGVSPSRLHVEITETMLLGLDDTVVAQITALADLGVRWYVDDFGTGYSSISHLRDLPVSGLKLDASFTAGIGAGSHTARQLAVALLGLANGLGLDTVAEGIETRAEADYLRTLGWRHGQGWLYGRAAPLP